MNWRQLNETYPQAFLEWIKVYAHDKFATKVLEIDKSTVKLGFEYKGYISVHIYKMERDVWQIPEYFDGLGIQINAEAVIWNNNYTSKVLIPNPKHQLGLAILQSKKEFYCGHYATRREAMEAGIIKAFEIREEQLKQL